MPGRITDCIGSTGISETGAIAVFDIQLAIHGKLAIVTGRAQIPGARQFHFAQNGENAPRAPTLNKTACGPGQTMTRTP